MNTKSKLKNFIYLIPLILIGCFVPLIVHFKEIPLNDFYFYHWKGNKVHWDLYSYYKAVFVIKLSLIALAFMFIKLYFEKKEIKRLRIYIPIAIYTIMVLLSTIFSEYSDVALNGFIDRFEGCLVIVSYIVILFTAVNTIDSEKDVKNVTVFLIIGACIACVIGVSELFGKGLLFTEIGKRIMLFGKYDSLGKTITTSRAPHEIYSTLYYKNFTGSYMCIFFLMTFGLFIVSENKKVKILLGCVCALVFSNLLGCLSRAGWTGSIFGVIVLIIMFRKKLRKNKFYILSEVLVFIFVFIGVNHVNGGKLLHQTKRMDIEYERQGSSKKNYEISSQGTLLNIKENNIGLNLFIDLGDSIVFYDNNKNKLNVKLDKKNNSVMIDDDKYKDYSFKIVPVNNEKILIFQKGGLKINFVTDNGEVKYVNNLGIEYDIKKVDKINIGKWEKFASGRGYIWSRSVPLLKDTLLLGHGPDTFLLYFPQNDVNGKLNGLGDPYIIVDKPHNMYLQQGINTGVISLIAFLVTMLMYIIQSIKIYFKSKFEDTYSKVGVCMLFSVVGYLVAGFFNDSIVCVAPVFWLILGIGIVCNSMLEQKQNIVY